MTRMVRGSGPRALAAVAAAAVALVLAGCGSTGASGEGVVTTVNTPSVAQTFTSAQVDAIVKPRAAAFAAAVKAFRKCDRKVAGDSFVASPCLKQAAAVTAVVDDSLGDLGSVTLPPSYATTLVDLKQMSAAGAAVAAKCKKANDQKCDQALARFRADEQSLLWDLDIKL